MEHSKLPWYKGERRGDTIDIRQANGLKEVTTLLFTSPDYAEANAKFIVKACNAHGELVEALKKTLELVDDAEWTQHQRQATIHGARAALTKIEGE